LRQTASEAIGDFNLVLFLVVSCPERSLSRS
jgi:hypothetical protein